MILLALLTVLLPTIYCDVLSYTTDGKGDIKSFSFAWKNPDQGNDELTGPTDGSIITDGNTETGETLTNPSDMEVWGSDPANPKGMTGEFLAETLNIDNDMDHWLITSMKVSFTATNDECWGSDSSANAWYIDADSGAMVDIGNADVQTDAAIITFSAPIGNAGVPTIGEVGFYVSSNAYCAEAQIIVTEFVLEGEQIPPFEHTCTGQVTWGDPHYHLMAVEYAGKGNLRFDYQGVGWYYYLFPCDIERDYADWPFFLLSDQQQCWWKGNPKSCIGNNQLILNTKPDPWIIEFYGAKKKKRIMSITVGSDPLLQRSADYYDSDTKLTNWEYSVNDPLVIVYNDDQPNSQSGEVHLYFDKNTVMVELHDVVYNAYPRTCNRGTSFGLDCGDYKCSGEVIQITSLDAWTSFTCPSCLMNIACGLMGHYIRGDCTKSELNDPTSPCSSILVGSDGNTYTSTDGKLDNTEFEQFAATWEKSTVEAVVSGNGGTVVTFQKGHKALDPMEGRAMDASIYEGFCFDNMERIGEVNETCRQNIVIQYDTCCTEIGEFCDELWGACIEDLCACTMQNAEGIQVMTEAECLDSIVHETMNTTCNWKGFHPEEDEILVVEKPVPMVQKVMKFIWVYAVFVLVFVLIAIGAYVYYRKKNNVKIFVPDDEEEEIGLDRKGIVDTGVEA